MGRPKGGKNSPKNMSELLIQLQEVAQKEGKIFSFDFKDASNQPINDIASIGTELFEIDTDGEGDRGFECGNCHEILASEVDKCPKCWSSLTWA